MNLSKLRQRSLRSYYFREAVAILPTGHHASLAMLRRLYRGACELAALYLDQNAAKLRAYTVSLDTLTQ